MAKHHTDPITARTTTAVPVSAERTAEALAEAARPESRIREVLKKSPDLTNVAIAELLTEQGVDATPEHVYQQRKILGLC